MLKIKIYFDESAEMYTCALVAGDIVLKEVNCKKFSQGVFELREYADKHKVQDAFKIHYVFTF